jgi:hypothetical protein
MIKAVLGGGGKVCFLSFRHKRSLTMCEHWWDAVEQLVFPSLDATEKESVGISISFKWSLVISLSGDAHCHDAGCI